MTKAALDIVTLTSEQTGVTLIGQQQQHTTFAVTNPEMYKYFKPDMDQMKKTKHVRMMAMIIHNSEDVRKNYVDNIIACALEPNCLAPIGAVWDNCGFDVNGKRYANCHRYHESATNILLNEWFNYDKSKFFAMNCCFAEYDEKHDVDPLYCGKRKGPAWNANHEL